MMRLAHLQVEVTHSDFFENIIPDSRYFGLVSQLGRTIVGDLVT